MPAPVIVLGFISKDSTRTYRMPLFITHIQNATVNVLKFPKSLLLLSLKIKVTVLMFPKSPHKLTACTYLLNKIMELKKVVVSEITAAQGDVWWCLNEYQTYTDSV